MRVTVLVFISSGVATILLLLLCPHQIINSEVKDVTFDTGTHGMGHSNWSVEN